MFPQLATLYFVARKVGQNVVIGATMCFKLQCNNVARQVEGKCCPYYRTLKVHCPGLWLLEKFYGLRFGISFAFFRSFGRRIKCGAVKKNVDTFIFHREKVKEPAAKACCTNHCPNLEQGTSYDWELPVGETTNGREPLDLWKILQFHLIAFKYLLILMCLK